MSTPDTFYHYCVTVGEALHTLGAEDRYILTGFLIQTLSGKTGFPMERATRTLGMLGAIEVKDNWQTVQRCINELQDVTKISIAIYTAARLLIKPNAYGGTGSEGGVGYRHCARIWAGQN